MPSDDPRTAVILCDSLALRRAAYLSLLDPWAAGNNIDIREGDDGLALADCDQPIALEICVLGAARVEEPAVQTQLLQRRRLRPGVPLALVSDHDDRAEVTAAFRHGARGFIPSSLEPDLARQAFGFILAGGTFFPPHILDRPAGDGAEAGGRRSGQAASLTPRQLDVLALLREGKSNKLIARDLSMCESTVKVHVRQIMRKLGAANRTQAALSAINAGGAGFTSAGQGSLAASSPISSDSTSAREASASDAQAPGVRHPERRHVGHHLPHELQHARAR